MHGGRIEDLRNMINLRLQTTRGLLGHHDHALCIVTDDVPHGRTDLD